MSATRRIQQWATFGRMWYMFDARWQNPYDSALKIANILAGRNKPIYHKYSDCGDHVVVVNSAHIALPGDEWEKRVFFHHTTYAGGASWTLAHQVHDRDPTVVMRRAVYSALGNNHIRRRNIARLHIFPSNKVPEKVMENISLQLRQLRPVPKRLDHYSKEEVNAFPKVFDWPKDYVLDPNPVYN